FRLDQANGGGFQELRSGFRGYANEGIVERVQNESGNGDLCDNPASRCTEVVIVGSGKGVVRGGDAFVKCAYGANRRNLCGVNLGKEAGFAVVSAHQVAQEMAFVEAIEALVQ